MAKPRFTGPQEEVLLSMGLDPQMIQKAMRRGANDGYALKDSIRRNLRIIDEQDAVNRFTWYNLPDGIDGKLLERILYYRGQAIFFYLEAVDKFYFLPYALNGEIDEYGRYKTVNPVPFANGATKNQKTFLNNIKRDVMYELPLVSKKDDRLNKCVLLRDYTNQESQYCIPRQQLNECLVDMESECLPYMRTALMRGTGVTGMRVESQDTAFNVEMANDQIRESSIVGNAFVPIIGQQEFQDFGSPTGIQKVAEFGQAMQVIDNLRLSTYGLSNGGMFNKKEHMLEDEAQMAGANTGLILNDSLTLRREFCDMVNSLWGLGIWVEITQPETPIMNQQSSMMMGDEEDDTSNASNTNNSNIE